MYYMEVDFETYYDSEYSLRKLTTSDYIRDPRFETIGVGITSPVQRSWLGHEQFKALAAQINWSVVAVVCHHAHFDGLILSHHYGVRPAFFIDTLSMARALHGQSGNSLADLAAKYQIGVKGTEVLDAAGKHRADFTPEEWAQYGRYCLNDCDLTADLRVAMIQQFSARELRLIDLTVKMFTDPVFVLDEPLMEEFLASERQRKHELIARVADDECPTCRGAGCDLCHTTGKDLTKWKKVVGSGPKFATLLRSLGVEPAVKPSPTAKNPDGTPKATFAFAKTDPFMKGLLEHSDDDVRLAAEARVEVKSTTTVSRSVRMLKLGEGGQAMPVYLKYSAAHTHRWGGADKTNWQNFGRGGTIRDAIMAPEGHVVVVADSAQIEARVTGWFCGQDDLVDAFRAGQDVYSEFATTAYGRPVDRKRKEIDAGGKVTYPDFIPGFVGKTCILGLGFGMGWLSFAATLQQGAMGGPPVTFGRDLLGSMGVNTQRFLGNAKKTAQVAEMPSRLQMSDRLVHCIVAEEIVTRYRKKNHHIPAMWKQLDQVLAMMQAGVVSRVGPGGVLVTEKEAIVLPNGLRLRYPGLENSGGQYTYWNGKMRVSIWGGALLENIVQALARIIVADQMVQIAIRWRVATMTHDEVVGVVLKDLAEECLQDMLHQMKQPPAWAPTIPVMAEGGYGQRYGDAK